MINTLKVNCITIPIAFRENLPIYMFQQFVRNTILLWTLYIQVHFFLIHVTLGISLHWLAVHHLTIKNFLKLIMALPGIYTKHYNLYHTSNGWVYYTECLQCHFTIRSVWDIILVIVEALLVITLNYTPQ